MIEIIGHKSFFVSITFDISGKTFTRSHWLDDGPFVYSIEMPGNSSFEKHSHEFPEFQLVLSGSGSIGGVPLSAGSLYYAGAEAEYGPLVAGPDGLKYLVFHQKINPGHQVTPAADGCAKLIEYDLEPRSTSIEPGACVQILKATAAEPLICEPRDVPMFYMLIAGNAKMHGADIAQNDLLYVSANELPFTLETDSAAVFLALELS